MHRCILLIALCLLAGCSKAPWHGWRRADDGPAGEKAAAFPEKDLPPPREVVAQGPEKARLSPSPASFSAPPRPARERLPDNRVGPTRKTEAAVLMGLVWLKNHQNPDGLWSVDRFTANCRKGTCTGPGSTRHRDLGVTALALLAFLGAGHTHKHGKFKRTVKQALKALKSRQRRDGSFGLPAKEGHRTLDHLMATAAVSEAYGLSHKTPLLRAMAQQAVDHAVRLQKPFSGWGHGVRPERCDAWTTTWAVLALKAAKMSGLTVTKEAFEGARAWLFNRTDETSGQTAMAADPHRYRLLHYRKGTTPPGFGPQPTATAGSVLCRIFMGASARDRLVIRGGKRLWEDLPAWDPSSGRIDLPYWFLGSHAAYQLGGDLWADWIPAMVNALVPTQHRQGCENGSWDPKGPGAEECGRVYATALAVLTLESYYRYNRVLGTK